jgi:hypothetical protein
MVRRTHFAGVDMLPAWLVPGPTLPWLDGLALVPDFMLAPVVVCDDIDE